MSYEHLWMDCENLCTILAQIKVSWTHGEYGAQAVTTAPLQYASVKDISHLQGPEVPSSQQADAEAANTCMAGKKLSRKNWGEEIPLVKTALKPSLLLSEERQMEGSCQMEAVLQAFWKLVSVSSCPFYWGSDWNLAVFQPGAAANQHKCSRTAELSVAEGEGAAVPSPC